MAEEYLFISDCHLDAGRPEVSQVLIRFLGQQAGKASRLYILGDLFEVWLGDDDPASGLESAITALTGLASAIPVYFMAGNRDFLLGERFAARVGLTLLEEPEYLQLGENRAVLIHGDTLCTDDHDYQTFRAQVRSPAWQAEFLAKPLPERQRIAARLRGDSTAAMAQKSSQIMDVNQQAVQACFAEHDVDTIVHGHTHRPAVHRYARDRTRYVLGDWHSRPSYLCWRGSRGFELIDPRL